MKYIILFLFFISFYIIYKKYDKIIYKDLYIDKSNIDGIGIFTKKNYNINDFIFTGIIDKNITSLGRKINHSWNPNTYLKKESNKYNIYANKYITKFKELTMNYKNTPDFIRKPLDSYK